ncbi:MAG: 4Fe-4S cluster-binding domain-containing protein [Deltaproteobacteria bacterium]|nr:MAG: 4Fe-4S cluster-binding domain-containing protein [Deltaproteobacteria bacterium]
MEAQLLSHQDVDMVVDPDILKRISVVRGYEETDDIMIHYTVTADCPFNCRGCINSLTSGQARQDGAARVSNMDVQEDVERDIRAMAQLIRRSGKAQAVIVFYGGEPMLRLDKMNRVYEHLSKMMDGRVLLKYMVVTSGHYLERSIQRYPGLTTHMWLTAISIDGTEAQHNEMRRGTSLETIKRQVASLERVRGGEVLIWSTIRPKMSLLDCFESFMYFSERGQAEHFFWHLDEAEGIIADLPDYVARYGAHLDEIMKVYVDHLKGGDLLSIIHVNELILYLLAQKRRGSTACAVEKMANFDIIGDGKVHACADLPETKCIGEIAESGEIIFEPDARARLSSLVAYKGDLGCKVCGVEAYCGGRCPVQIHTGGIERARQYCFMMREHVRTVKKYTGQIADLMLEHGLTLADIYRSARYAKYTDVTP